MNAFPKAIEALLSAYRTAKDSIAAAEFEPGATPLQQTALRELDVKIRQYEQQAGQSQPMGGLVIEPLVRRIVQSGPVTEIAGVPLSLPATTGEIDPFVNLTIENLTYDEMTEVADKAGLLGFPVERDARIEHLQRAMSEGLFAPAVVEQRLRRNELLAALTTQEADKILDTFGEDTVRIVGKMLLGDNTVNDKEPKNVMNKKFVGSLKDAAIKRADLEKAKEVVNG